MMKSIPRIIITPGEPAGIGPDILIRIAEEPWEAELIAIADPQLIEERAKLMGKTLKILKWDVDSPSPHQPHTLKLLPISLAAPVKPGELNVLNANYVLNTLSTAFDLATKYDDIALVTGPVQKSILNKSGFKFSGHTEFFQERAKVSKTVMLFVTDAMRVALATTHLPLNAVANQINTTGLKEVITIMHQALIDIFGIKHPRILVCGLNPHAGEAGILGREEIEVIEPTLEACRKNGMTILGPFPADTIFTPKMLALGDAVLAMYHDQALPVVKYAGFGTAVNVTLGLPFIRTSVDHGTALDIAGTRLADPNSMKAAINLALKLSRLG